MISSSRNLGLGRHFADAAKKTTSARQKVVLLPGDGIGPEITESVMKIYDTLKIPIEWEHHVIHTKAVTASGDLISEETMSAIRHHKFALKGPFATPIGKGHRSLNVTLRKKLKLFANVRPCKTIEGVQGLPHSGIDLVTMRENTEGEYSGLEHEVVPGVVENLKIISRGACLDIAEYAFKYAQQHGRKKILSVHKAGVMVLGDGCFVDTCREVSEKYPNIQFAEKQVDTMAMKLVKAPETVDMMVMPNLYGDIISDLCAGLIGGLGLTASGNIGYDCAVYEAVHGSAPDIAGQDLCNPTALLLSSVMMLKDMGLTDFGNQIEAAVFATIKEGKWLTGDLGGKSTNSEYVKAIIGRL